MKRTPFRRKVPAIGKKQRVGLRKRAKHTNPRIWSMHKADDEISLWIRTLYGRCQFPNCTVTEISKLQCSHYIGRATKSTRFLPDNLIALCWYHHFKSKEYGWEYQKQRIEKHGWDGQYTLFMQKHLGEERWNNLMQLSTKVYPLSSAIMDCMRFLGKL